MVYFLIFLFGSLIGSFLNVCIYRIPRGESIVFPGSRCVNCKKAIYWYDNIPLVSYVLLGGKCRFCKAPIIARYFIVEFLAALVSIILYTYFGISYKFFIYTALSFGLIVVSFIDLEFQIIPDRVSLGGIPLGIVCSLAFPGLHGSLTWLGGMKDSLLGIIIGGASLYIMGSLGNLAFKKESMGGGDIKLMAMLGAFLGWKKILIIFFLSPFFGIIPGLYFKFTKKTDIIPYGPFIAIAAMTSMIWGDRIIAYFLF